MPTATQTKRVKGKRITRAFVIGSEAWRLNESTRPEGIPADHTTGWRVYVKGIEGGPNITTWLKKVQFKLFHTYNNPLRTCEGPPFEVRETGWGGFPVDVRLHFQPYANEKPQWRSHYLQLEPYGNEEEKKMQQERNLVVSETCDFVDFNEPTDALWDALTDEAQWGGTAAQPKSGGGKGKGRPAKNKAVVTASTEDDESKWAILPEKPSPDNPYSLQMERTVIDMLQEAEKEVNVLLEEQTAKRDAAEAKIKELSNGEDDAVVNKK